MDWSWLNQIWVWLVGGLSGVTLGTIITWLNSLNVSRSINKTIRKYDPQKAQNEAIKEGLDKIKGVTFKHEIKPIVESELVKVNENAVKSLKKELAEIKGQYTKVVLILKKLSAYFDDSIVSDAKKEELHEAIAQAEETPSYVESVVIEEALKEEYPQPEETEDEDTDTIVER